MHYNAFLQNFLDRAEQLFLDPQTTYSWHAIITGASVARPNGSARVIAAVERNTFRGFHKLDKTAPGAAEAFRRYLGSQRDALLDALSQVRCRQDLHVLANRLAAALHTRLDNIKPAMLASYNKLRKPLDLYLEHLVAMAAELSPWRGDLVQHLYLPLDSQMFAQTALFTDAELRDCGLHRRSAYAAVSTESAYLRLQTLVKERAGALSERCGRPFHPIYFDLLWNDRYRRWGSNLFETNP